MENILQVDWNASQNMKTSKFEFITLYFKTCILMAIFFGFLIGLKYFLLALPSYGVLYAIIAWLIKGTTQGLLFGLVCTSILVPLHYYFFKKSIENLLKPVSFKARQNFKFVIKNDESNLNRILDILKTIFNDDISIVEENADYIMIKTPKTWKCFSERFSVQLKHENEKYFLDIVSQPVNKLTMLDYGKNYENILKFYKELIHKKIV